MTALEIVIVSSTGALELLRTCLRTIRENPYSGGETLVHVVDNASTDGTPEMVRDEFPEVKLHALDWNAGFCVANNVALGELRAPYVLVLNPDTEIYPGSLDHMMELMEGDPSIGMSSCRLEQRDGSLDHASKRSFPTPLGSLAHFAGVGDRLGPRLGQYKAPELGEHELGDVDAVNGAYMLIRKSAMDQVGLLDEGYWLYMEDLDWCRRFWLAGWKVFYEPAGVALHVKGGSSARRRAPRQEIAFHRGMGRFYRRFDAPEHNPLVNAAVYAGVAAKLGVSLAITGLRGRD